MLEDADDRVSLARDMYTYLHVVVIAGVIVTAVGDESMIEHPLDPLKTAQLLTVVGGPILYLMGQVLMRRRAVGSFSWRRQIACGALVVIGLISAATDAIALVVGALVLLVLVGLIVYEEYAYRRDRDSFPIDLRL